MPLPQLHRPLDLVDPPVLNGRILRRGDTVQHYRRTDGMYRYGQYVAPFRNDPTGETVLVDFDDDEFWQGPVPVSLLHLERPL